MQKTCTISALGFRADFLFSPAPLSPEYAVVQIELYLGQGRSNRLISSPQSFIMLKDIQRLVDYLETHITKLLQLPDTESPVFLPLELGFQVQALGGELEDSNEGILSLRVFVNAQADSDSERVYVGCEGGVEVRGLRAFMASLLEVMRCLENNQPHCTETD